MTRWGYVALGLALATLAGSAVVQALYHDSMPEKVPTHWGLDGQPDGWTSKDRVVLIFYALPLAALGVITLGLFVLPWLSPRNYSVEGFRRTYEYVFALVAGVFAFLHATFLWATIHSERLPERPFLAGFFVFFALVGNVLGKVKSNFWLGIRTPWTLADPKVWDRTHRVGAWSFTTVGVIGAIAVLLGVPPIGAFFGVIVGALWPVVYSAILYKRLERTGQLTIQQSGEAVSP